MAVYKPRRLRNETEPEQVREPSLYRSLCTSLLSTLLSLVMLVGTTFAWFTESITTGVYTITAGNLSTVTSYCTDLDKLDWQLLNESNTTLFGGMTFSNPDTTQTAYLKLENESSSPVKYLISFVCGNETAGTLKNSNGTNTPNQELSKLMSFAYTVASDATTEGSTLTFGPSENGKVTLGDSKGKPFSILVPGGGTVHVKLELTLGSYEGEWTGTLPSIDLKLKLVITQPDNNDLEDGSSTTSQALQAGTPVTNNDAETSEGATLTVGVTIENELEAPAPAGEPADKPIVEPAVEPVVGPAAEPSTETATAPAAEDTSSAKTAQELSSAPETTE